MARTKAELRKAMRGVLNAITKEERTRQSSAIFNKVIKHPKYISSNLISIFLGKNNEIDTSPILRHALEVGKKRCFIPMIGQVTDKPKSSTRMLMVELSSMKEFDDLPLNQYGIKEPIRTDINQYKVADPVDGPHLDLALVPGVAFSMDGRRLGHGKGYYDEYLTDWKRLCERGALYSIGLAFAEQIVDDPLATSEQDYKLDEVLTGGQ